MVKRKASSDALSTNLPWRSRIAHIPLVSILPKPTAGVSKDTCSEAIPHRNLAPGRQCRVLQCRIVNCHLVSHRYYEPVAHRHGGFMATVSCHDSTRTGNIHHLDNQPILPLVKGGVDGMPALPLDGLDESVGSELFHNFFSHQYPRIVRLVMPPPISESQRRVVRQNKEEAFSAAVSGPLFCLNVIASVHYEQTYKGGSQDIDRLTVTLRAKLVSLLRRKLNNFDNAEVVDIVAVILTLVMFEAATDNMSVLTAHRKAMECLVSSQGGITRMARALPYTLTLDRCLSTLTNLPPCFPLPSNRAIRRPLPCPNIYGGFFDHRAAKEINDDLLVNYCSDLCRTIELLERENWSFGICSEAQEVKSDLHYLYFLRENLSNDFVILNAKIAHLCSISRCILLAARIIDYTIFHDNYLATVSLHLANTVRSLLCELKLQLSSPEQINITIWILFVLLCAPFSWSGQKWAIIMMKELLNTKYHSKKWPNNWRHLEHENVLTFVWSSKRFCTSWDIVCNDLSCNEEVTSKFPLDLIS